MGNILPEDKFLSSCGVDGGKQLLLVKVGTPNTLLIVDLVEREAITNVALTGVDNFVPCCLYDDKGVKYAIGHTDLSTTSYGVKVHNVVSVNTQTGSAVVCKYEDKSVARTGLSNLQAFTVRSGAPNEGVLIGTYGDVLLWNPTEEKPHTIKSAACGKWPEKPLPHYLKQQHGISVDEVLTMPVTMIAAGSGHSVVMTGCKYGAMVGWKKPKDVKAKEASVVCLKGHTNLVRCIYI